MGITINYDLKFDGNAKDLCKKLEVVKQKCLDLPFEEVRDIIHIKYSQDDINFYNQLQDETFYPNNTDENLKKRDKKLKERGIDISTMINLTLSHKQNSKGYEFVELYVWAGEGCEATSFVFVKNKDCWECDGFTKTQYATEFVKCHLLVIKVLDLLKEEGFNVEVRDEGEYWETRDFKELAKSINEYTNLLKMISGKIEKAIEGTDFSFEANVAKCENYMKINKPDK